VARFVAVAILALAVATISGVEAVTTGGADAPPPSTLAAALLPDDAVHGTETVGVQPHARPRSGAPPASLRCDVWRSRSRRWPPAWHASVRAAAPAGLRTTGSPRAAPGRGRDPVVGARLRSRAA
jgi:hypothetical protein